MLAVAVGAFVVTAAVRDDGATDPVLRFAQDVPADGRAETETTWRRFLDVVAGRRSCVGDVTVVLERRVEGGDARYVGAAARIEIQIPTTPERYRESLAHELAHHLERTCADVGELQAALTPSLVAPGQAWSVGSTWEETPSERFAEAVVVAVNGSRVRHTDTVVVEPEVVELIERWGRAERDDSP